MDTTIETRFSGCRRAFYSWYGLTCTVTFLHLILSQPAFCQTPVTLGSSPSPEDVISTMASSTSSVDDVISTTPGGGRTTVYDEEGEDGTTTSQQHGVTIATTSWEIEEPVVIWLEGKDSSTLDLSWEKYSSAIEYYIRYHPKDHPASMEIKHVFAPVTTAKLSALDPDTTYMIELEAKLPSNIFITVGSTELKTSSEEIVADNSINIALLYAVFILAAIVIILLFMMFILYCWLLRPRSRSVQTINETPVNGQATTQIKMGDLPYELEHHNPGYVGQDDDDNDDIDQTETSQAYIYISPESSPLPII